MRKKGLFAALLAAMLIFSTASAQAGDISIVVNGETLETQTPAVIVNDRTLVPLRAVSEALGIDVAWDGETKGIILTDGTDLITTWIGRDHAFKTSYVAIEDYVVMEAPPVIMNDFTMVPLRAVAELFGAEVGWDGASGTVTVTCDAAAEDVSGFAEMFMQYEQLLSSQYEVYKDFTDGKGNTVNAEIQLENGGVVELLMYPDIAPATVSNFVKLANEGFYDGLIFHRVIKDFMVQGGSFDAEFAHRDADTITGEFLDNGFFNLIPHVRGTISMARTKDVDSASSQFFIMHGDSKHLDGQYAAFGKVIRGMEYIDDIADTATESIVGIGDDVPVTNQIINTIVIK